MTSLLPRFDPPEGLAIAEPFWAAIARGELVMPRCSVCGAWQWYPDVDGTDCTGGTLEWQQVSTTGTVYSFTRVHRSFLPGGRDHVPYVVGLIDLDGVDAARLVGSIDDEPGVAVGARVGAQFESLGDRTHLVFRMIGRRMTDLATLL